MAWIPEAAALVGKAETAKKLAETAKSSKEFADKAADVKDAVSAIKELVESFNVTGPAIQLLFAQINASTIDSRVKLITTLLEFVETPAVQEALSAFSGFLDAIFGLITTMLTNERGVKALAISFALLASDLDYLRRIIEQFSAVQQSLQDMVNSANSYTLPTTPPPGTTTLPVIVNPPPSHPPYTLSKGGY